MYVRRQNVTKNVIFISDVGTKQIPTLRPFFLTGGISARLQSDCLLTQRGFES